MILQYLIWFFLKICRTYNSRMLGCFTTSRLFSCLCISWLLTTVTHCWIRVVCIQVSRCSPGAHAEGGGREWGWCYRSPSTGTAGVGFAGEMPRTTDGIQSWWRTNPPLARRIWRGTIEQREIAREKYLWFVIRRGMFGFVFFFLTWCSGSFGCVTKLAVRTLVTLPSCVFGWTLG
jgi:hypothetical protein